MSKTIDPLYIQCVNVPGGTTFPGNTEYKHGIVNVRKLPLEGYPLTEKTIDVNGRPSADLDASLAAADRSFVEHLEWLWNAKEPEHRSTAAELQRVQAGMQPLQAELQRLQVVLTQMKSAETKLKRELDPKNMQECLLKRAEKQLSPFLVGYTDLKMSGKPPA